MRTHAALRLLAWSSAAAIGAIGCASDKPGNSAETGGVGAAAGDAGSAGSGGSGPSGNGQGAGGGSGGMVIDGGPAGSGGNGAPGGASAESAGNGGAGAPGGRAGDAGASGAGASGVGASGSGGTASAGAAGVGGTGAGTVPPVPLDASLLSKCTGTKPIRCTIAVPANGNYNVTVELGSAQAASHSQIEAELARIVVPTVRLASGEYSQHTFSVNVRNEVHDDYTFPGRQLDVVISGDAPALHGIGYTAANIPTLFVVGDSTVCDSDPVRPERGWAQEFSMYLKPGLAVANYADAGDTAGSLYTKFASRGAVLKAGDYLFIQFGHNDMKSAVDIASYKTNLRRFITDARSANATPILFSPVARRAYLDDRTKPTTLEDPGFNGLEQQARDLAAAERVAFVDLTTLSLEYYAGVDAPALFSSRTEIAHFNTVGATAISKLVADALKVGTTPATSIADFLK